MDYRLPTTVVPKRYDLRLEPDLAAATFAGEAVITVEVETTLTEIVLNAAELAIQSVSVSRNGGVPIHGAITLELIGRIPPQLQPTALFDLQMAHVSGSLNAPPPPW